MVKRQQFTAEFKREAVRQMKVGDKPIAQLSRELGVPRNRLYKWSLAVQAVGEKEAFPGSGRRSPEQAELMRLRRELARTQMELEILKKAEAYFASAPPRGTPGSKGSKKPTR
jgi:transposase